MPRTQHMIRLVALLAVLGGLLAACGGTAPAAQPTTAPADAPTAAPADAPTSAPVPTSAPGAAASPQETLVFAADLSDQISMDPAVVYEFGGLQVVGNVYETLVSFEPVATIMTSLYL